MPGGSLGLQLALPPADSGGGPAAQGREGRGCYTPCSGTQPRPCPALHAGALLARTPRVCVCVRVARRSGWVGWCACGHACCTRHSGLRFARRGQRCLRVCLACSRVQPSPCPPSHVCALLARSPRVCVRVCVARRSGWVGWCACCIMVLIRHSDLRFARRGQRCFRVCLACALLTVSQCVTA